MRRRVFVAMLGAGWPVRILAEPLPVIGFLHPGSADSFPYLVAAFRQGLNELGYVEDKNVGVEYRWAEGRYEQLPALAADLVGRKVSVIVNGGGPPLAARAATATIPIVSMLGGDPIKTGMVASINRPGGNVTGVVNFSYSLGPKRLAVLREATNAKLIAILVNPSNPDPETEFDRREVQSVARELGQQVLFVRASDQQEIDLGFDELKRNGVGALLVMADPMFTNHRAQLIELAARNNVPTIYDQYDIVAAGGLMSYGASLRDAYRLLGTYAGKILRGVKPADLPVQQSVKIELVLNMNTARSLGLTFPTTLLARADEVIE
jgi:ABC-type uncharacterized transport system substrate-binding protein